MLWDEFVAIPNGTRILNHNFDQCVALANLYHEQVIGGAFVPVGSAYQWSTDFSRYLQLTSNYTQLPAHANPEPGDIFVSRGGIYNSRDGHIGVVVRSWNGSTFGTKEQNAENNRYVYQTYNRTKANMLSYLRPKQSPIPKPKPKEDEEMATGAFYRIGSGQGAGAIYWQETPTAPLYPLTLPEWTTYSANGNKYADLDATAVQELFRCYGVIQRDVKGNNKPGGTGRPIRNTEDATGWLLWLPGWPS